MAANQPYRDEHEIWPEIAEALHGLNDGQQAVIAALHATLKRAKRALRERSRGSEDPRSEVACLVTEILPDEEMLSAKQHYPQHTEIVKSARYRRVDNVLIEETFAEPVEAGPPTPSGSIERFGSIQISRGEKPEEEGPRPARGNPLSRKAAWWDQPFGIFERSVPEGFYHVRHALREHSPERPGFIESLHTVLEAQVLVIERDRGMAQESPGAGSSSVMPNTSVESFTATRTQTAASKPNETLSHERRELLQKYKTKCRIHGIRVTDKKIAQAASPRWRDRTPVARWKACDRRCTASDDRKIRAVIKDEPHLKDLQPI